MWRENGRESWQWRAASELEGRRRAGSKLPSRRPVAVGRLPRGLREGAERVDDLRPPLGRDGGDDTGDLAAPKRRHLGDDRPARFCEGQADLAAIPARRPALDEALANQP